jgi:pilus assembly protein CpaB
MKKNLVPLVSIAFVVAAICTAVFYGLVSGKMTSAQASAKGTIVVAGRAIRSGEKVSAADAKVLQASESNVENTFRTPAQVEGLTATRDIKAEEPLTAAKLASAETGGGLGIPLGKRAISIQVSDSTGVLAVLESGHRVDVLAIHGEGNGALAKTLLRNLEVLRVTRPDPQAKEGRPVVTLLATPAEADQLALADAVTRVRLLLRNPLEKGAGNEDSGRVDVPSLMQAPAVASRRVGGQR